MSSACAVRLQSRARIWAQVLLFSLFLLSLLIASPAHAAKLRTEVSVRKIGVGQTFAVQVTAVQGDGDPEPTNPQLKVSGPAEVSGPSLERPQPDSSKMSATTRQPPRSTA